MAAKVTTPGFVAINHNGRTPYIMTWSARAQANQVKDAVVDNWPRHDGVRQTWADIRKQGVSIEKVRIETVRAVKNG